MNCVKLENILSKLKSLGAIGIKTSFEDEGADFDDILVLRKLTNNINFKLVIKIGGAEANTDINMALKLDCDGIVAPMIESSYALKKYLNTILNINKFNSSNIEKGINLESITAHNNINNILLENINNIDCITIGRVDLVGSLNKDRNYINSEEMYNIVNNTFSYIKKTNNNIKTYLGGSINNESKDFINKLRKLINYVETRYIIFDINKLLQNYEKCIELANIFEYYWLNYINTSYKIEKNKKRIEMIKKRINLPLEKNIISDKTLILYAYYETDSSKNNLIYFLENGIINNSNYHYYINYSFKTTINFDKYTNKYNNLFILNINSTNAWSSWYNIIKKIKINEYNNFIFLKDKIRGPYNMSNTDWVKYITNNINDETVIIAGYGTSPLGKLYKFPYIPDKFICMNTIILQFLLNNNIFEEFTYNSNVPFNYHPDNININNNPDNGIEIKLSKLLLNNNIEYVSFDKNGVNNLNILNLFNNNKYNELYKLNENLHSINDTTIINRIFWTGRTMVKIFEEKNNKFIKKLNKIRDTSKLEKW